MLLLRLWFRWSQRRSTCIQKKYNSLTSVLEIKMKLDLSSFENALDQLEDALKIYNSTTIQKDLRLKLHMRAAAIQAFEFTYELCFKMMKRYLKESEASSTEIDTSNFNKVMRRAYAASLTKRELVFWKVVRNGRNKTSHVYQEETAQAVFDIIPDFLNEARYIFDTLRKKTKDLE